MSKLLGALGLGLVGLVLAGNQARSWGDDKAATAAIVGTYKIVAGEEDGKKLPANELKGDVVTFGLDQVTGIDKDKKEIFVATYTLDTSKKPWVIHMKSVMAPRVGERAEGLLEKDGDNLKLIYALPGGKMPTSFSSQTKQHLFVMKKIAAR